MDEIEKQDVATEEKGDTAEVETEVATEVVQTESKPEKVETPEARAARLLRQTNQARKKAGLPPLSEAQVAKDEAKVETTRTTGELDETQLDYLDLKGYTEQEDIEIIQTVMQKTGKGLRETLKDDYVISKLKDNKQAREVKAATPSSTKRAGNNINDSEDYWYQKYERDGKLPSGMPKGMAERLVNRKASSVDTRRNPYE